MKQGDRVKIIDTNNCSKAAQNTVGCYGVIDIIYQHDNDNANIAVIIDGIKTDNKNGCIYFRERNLELVKNNEYRGERIMRTENILELFKKNGMEKLNQELKEEVDKWYKLDPFYSSVNEKINEVNKLLREQGYEELDVNVSSYTHNITDGNIAMVNSECSEKSLYLKKYCNEVKTMCSACDTYEQEIEVLKNYKIIDENGMLIKE